MKCGDPPRFHDGSKCDGQKLSPGQKRCDWNDAHDYWGNDPLYNTNITYECPEGYVMFFCFLNAGINDVLKNNLCPFNL